MSLSNQEIRLAVYQTYARNSGINFDTDYGDKVANWIIYGSTAPAVAGKPEVEYDPARYTYIKEGQQAEVFALNHPRLGTNSIITSTVLKYDGATGAFETKNTLYVPAGRV